MLFQRAEEGGGAGEEPLLEGHQHEVGGELLGVLLAVLACRSSVYSPEGGVDALLFGRVIDFEGLQHPLGEPVVAVVVLGQFRLEAPDHHRLFLTVELLGVGVPCHGRTAGCPAVRAGP